MATKRSRTEVTVTPSDASGAVVEPAVRKRARKPTSAGDAAPVEEADHATSASASGAGKSKRFLLFVGNIPFTAPYDAILEHFACVGRDNITELRLLTRKKGETRMVDGRPLHKGCGFIEFATDAALKKALKLHHTTIKGHGDAPGGKIRKINVELTAGGGGSGEHRKQRIAKKNDALAEERRKHHEEIQTAPPPPPPAPAPPVQKPVRGEASTRPARDRSASRPPAASADHAAPAAARTTRPPKAMQAASAAPTAAAAASGGFRGGQAFAKQLAASMA